MQVGSITVPVNLPSADLAAFVKKPRAANCRFDFEMKIDGPFEFRANGETLWRYELDSPPEQAAPHCVETIPMPPSDIIAVTQGGGSVDAYRDSILSGVTTMKATLGFDPRSILDVGCGTGRLLIGWHCDDPTRRLAGVDINPQLIEWNRANLREVARWEVCALSPPLDFPDASFDLIQFISVFTHLPLERQREWVAEVRRLLRPGGASIITLHGEVYASILLEGELREQYDRDGHVAVAGAAEGANAFASFHRPEFARELFRDFDVTFFERGPRDRFPIASLQDVYLLRR